jgi:prophage antirepressor-like protein
MDYKKNLIAAYEKLDKAVEIHLANGGTVDDRPQLHAELLWRLKELENPPKEAMKGEVKLWSDGRWYAKDYHTVIDMKDYPNIVPITKNKPVEEYYGRLHIWIRNAFLRDSDLACSHVCGMKRNIVHHIDENKRNNHVANLVVIPSGLHHIYHPSNTVMKADTIAVEFCKKYGNTTNLDTIPQVFTFETTNVRVIIKDGDPWWVLSDVCRVLGVENSRDVAKRLDVDQKGVDLTDTLGGCQKMTTINESGLYSVIFRSDKPEAKRFQKWVFSEVLPQIRKTGSYNHLTLTNNQKVDGLHRLQGEFPIVISAIEAEFSKSITKNKALTTQLDTWINLVGDGGYISKRTVKNLKKELQNV